VPDTLKALQEALGLLRENARIFEKFSLYNTILGEGESLLAELSAADARQETQRFSELPRKVADYYAAKGLMYLALKMINDAGQAYYASDPGQSAKFNLSILYRKAPARTATPPVN